MITTAPSPDTVMKALDCVQWTTYSTSKLLYSCIDVAGIGPERVCTWVGGTTSRCLKGGRQLIDDAPPYTPHEITMTDIYTSTITTAPGTTFTATTTVATYTGTARIKATMPTAVGASWTLTLSESLMGDIFDISASAGVCGVAKARSLGKRHDFGGTAVALACDFTRLSPQRQGKLTHKMTDLLENEEIDVGNFEQFEEMLASAARELPSAMLDDPEPDLSLAELEAEEAVNAMPVLVKQAAMSQALRYAIFGTLMGGGVGGVIYAVHEITNAEVVKAAHDVKPMTSVPLPQTSFQRPTRTRTTSSSTTEACAVCTASAQCALDPNDDQGADAIVPPILTTAPTSPASPTTEATAPTTQVTAPNTEVTAPNTEVTAPITEVTAPMTKGYSSPTAAVPTGTASCQPGGGGGANAAESIVWKQKFMQDMVTKFCTDVYDHPVLANASNPYWKYEQYAADMESRPIFHDIGVYIHYEKQACPTSHADREVQLGGDHGDDCYAHFEWLWQTGCDAVVLRNVGDVGTERYLPAMGYYSDCMWWGIAPPSRPPSRPPIRPQP